MHQCEICFATFSRRYNLKRHVHTIHADSRHRCGFCDSSFSHIESYNQHLKNRESCPHCNYTCCGKQALYRHIKIIHREKLYTIPSTIQDSERSPIQPLISAMSTSHIQSAAVRKKCNHIYTDSDGHYHTQDNLREDIPDNIFINTVTTTGNNLF